MSKCLIALRTVFVAARTVYVLHVKSKAIKSLGLKTSAGSMTLSLRRPLAGSGLHFPSHRISWRRQKKDTLELFTSSFPSSTRRGHFSPCARPGPRQPEIGIPQCEPLKPLAGFTLALSLNAAPSQGDRTQGKALVEKSKKSRETMSRRQEEGSRRGETHHTREKVEKQ